MFGDEGINTPYENDTLVIFIIVFLFLFSIVKFSSLKNQFSLS